MSGQFWWAYDILTAVIIVFFVYKSAKKGFSKIIVTIIGCVASVAIAYAASRQAAAMVYDKFIKKTSLEAVNSAMEEYDPSNSIKEIIEGQGYGALADENRIRAIISSSDVMSGLYNYANNAAGDTVDTPEGFSDLMSREYAKAFGERMSLKLPPYVAGEISNKMSGSKEIFEKTLEVIMRTPDKAPDYIEENFIKAPGERLSQTFVFIIVFFICMAVIGFVSVKASSFGLLNGYDGLDKFFGAVIGVIGAAAAMLVAAAVIQILICVAESDGSFLSHGAVEKTIIFRHFFDKV